LRSIQGKQAELMMMKQQQQQSQQQGQIINLLTALQARQAAIMMPLRIIVWNADGVSTKLPEVKCIVRRHEIDVLLLSETHCKGTETPKLFGLHCQ